jgi:hypothetical protein
MAVSWRASGTSGDNAGAGTSITNTSLTVPTGITNGVVVAFVSLDATGAITNAAPTCNGHAMSLVADYQVTANTIFLQIYAFLQSQAGWATGVQTVFYNPSNWNAQGGSTYLDVACFDGVNQTNATTAFTNANTKTAATQANDVLITTAANNAVVALFAGIPANQSYAVVNGGTSGQSIISASDPQFGHGCEYQLITSGTSFDMTWTASAAATWYGLGVNIVAAVIGGTTTYHWNLEVDI